MSQVWPTLSRDAQREDFRQFPLVDPTVRSVSLRGDVISRDGPVPLLYGYSFTLRHLSVADKELLETLQTTIQVGGDTITWNDLRPSANSGGTVGEHTVRLAQPFFFDLDDDGVAYRTDVELHEEPGS